MSKKSLTARINWISEEFGGRKRPAFVGMRPNIRWQRFVEDWLHGSSDAEIVELDGDKTNAVLRCSENSE